MSDATPEQEPPFHLFLDAAEVPVTAAALRLYISDEAHERQIRLLARAVLDQLAGAPDERGVLTVTLSPPQMKVTHAAVRLLLNDLRRDQPEELELLRAVLEKLPDEHVMRAIEL